MTTILNKSFAPLASASVSSIIIDIERYFFLLDKGFYMSLSQRALYEHEEIICSKLKSRWYILAANENSVKKACNLDQI
jgi:hypothetical protein